MANDDPDKLPPRIAELAPEWQELWKERVAIMHYDGGMSKARAKWEAEQDIRKLAKQEG